MIKNERQYRITKAQAERFERALVEREAEGRNLQSDVHPDFQNAEKQALESQLADLREELTEYEALKSGQQAILEVESFDQLPDALVKARIAAGLSQKELAERLGLKEQQIQRYEATDYAGASMARVLEITKVLNLRVLKSVFLPNVEKKIPVLQERLKEIGLDWLFALKRLVPENIQVDTDAPSVTYYVTTAVSRIFGLSPTALFGADSLQSLISAMAPARFKLAARFDEKRLNAYTFYAHYLALLLLDATSHLPPRPIPADPEELHKRIMADYGSITFENVLRFVWDLGVPVLPLNDSGAFHGACWRVGGRNVLVLKQQTNSLARWLFDLLHELYHASQETNQDELSVIESLETAEERRRSPEEQTASQFAGEVILSGRAEALVKMCVDATKGTRAVGRLELLKSVLPKVAARENVQVDALANYMAFRLSLQGENWWGAATNLQRTDNSPWRIARDILLERVNFARIKGPDRKLLVQALFD